MSSLINDAASVSGDTTSIAPSSMDAISPQQSIDTLFDRTADISLWEPVRPPQALGELMDSRYMMPLLFPSDPRLLSAMPGKKAMFNDQKRTSLQTLSSSSENSSGHGQGHAPSTPLPWVSRNRKIRKVNVGTLQWVDGIRSASRWGRPVAADYEPGDEADPSSPEDVNDPDPTIKTNIHLTHLTRKPSGRATGKARPSADETTPVDGSFDLHHATNSYRNE